MNLTGKRRRLLLTRNSRPPPLVCAVAPGKRRSRSSDLILSLDLLFPRALSAGAAGRKVAGPPRPCKEATWSLFSAAPQVLFKGRVGRRGLWEMYCKRKEERSCWSVLKIVRLRNHIIIRL